MEFTNHTPFPALAFEGIDQHDQSFHVIVLRQTLTWDKSDELAYADEQAPLCEADEYFGDMHSSSVRQESDLCQYKPRCDVVVNATAYAPQGKPVTHFPVRLAVRRPDSPAPLPERPQGLNPFMEPSPAALAQWRAAVEQAKGRRLPGAALIDKTLTVTGERQFRKKRWPVRLVQWAVQWGTLTLIRPNPWKLTAPQQLATLPLRYEYAWGGQNRIDAGDKRAKRVPEKHRLDAGQRAGHPDRDAPAEQQAVAHSVCEPNPLGLGYAQPWWLKAARVKALPAPQIADADHALNARLFQQALRGKPKPGRPEHARPFEPAGFGIRAKTHPERRVLLGTVDDAFVQSKQWLPHDFDFAIWNAAPPDQQTAFLNGDEVIELTNLCAPDTPGASVDAKGNTVLRLALLRHECHLLVRLHEGAAFVHPLSIDTVIVEPDSQCLTLVWRAVLARDEDAPIRALEARMHSFEERDRLRAEIDEIKARLPEPGEPQIAEAQALAGEAVHE